MAGFAPTASLTWQVEVPGNSEYMSYSELLKAMPYVLASGQVNGHLQEVRQKELVPAVRSAGNQEKASRMHTGFNTSPRQDSRQWFQVRSDA
jgi:hypothetical protein